MIILSVIVAFFSVFIIGNQSNALAQSCPSIPANTGTATFTTQTNEGTYRVWARMKASSSTNNSFYLTVGGNCPVLIGDSAQISTSNLTWVDYKNGDQGNKIDLNLPGGPVVVTLNGNESGVAVDKVLFTKDLSCVPTGSGDNCVAEPTPIPTGSPDSGPIISGVRAYDITNTQAKITWNLDRVATGQVEYGPTESYGNKSKEESSFDWNYHIQNIAGLTPGITYNYRVISRDQSSNESVSENFTFTTTGGVGETEITSTPTPTFSPTPTRIPSKTPTRTPSKTPTPTRLPTKTPTPTPQLTKTLILNPTADSYVRSSSPNTNYGKLTTIQTDRNPTVLSYLKFDLSPLAGRTISKATLRLRVLEPSNQNQSLQMSSSNSWTETSITYNRRPALSGTSISFRATPANTTLGINVLNFVNSRKGKEITLGITSAAGDDWATFYSREASNRPVIIIEYK